MKNKLVEEIDKILEKEGHLVDWGYSNTHRDSVDYSHYDSERRDLAQQIADKLTIDEAEIKDLLDKLLAKYGIEFRELVHCGGLLAKAISKADVIRIKDETQT